MQTAIARFLRYLHVERNASELTVKSYREDLTSLSDYLAQSLGRPTEPAQITTADLRGYVSALHEAAYAKSSVSRRLACLRSFFRFALRENLVPWRLCWILRTRTVVELPAGAIARSGTRLGDEIGLEPTRSSGTRTVSGKHAGSRMKWCRTVVRRLARQYACGKWIL